MGFRVPRMMSRLTFQEKHYHSATEPDISLCFDMNEESQDSNDHPHFSPRSAVPTLINSYPMGFSPTYPKYRYGGSRDRPNDNNILHGTEGIRPYVKPLAYILHGM